VIFLDIDGVLNREQTTERIGEYVGLDEDLVRRFLRVVRQTGADVVLTSTWRLEPEMRTVVESRIKLKGVTDNHAGPRGAQIARWLAAHRDYERHAVLDDSRDMVDGLTTFFTEPRIGLTQSIAEAVGAHLLPVRWVHIAPGDPCAHPIGDHRTSTRETCGRLSGSHGPLEHEYVPPIIVLDHEAVPGSSTQQAPGNGATDDD
jgi:hypothetical protein